METTTTTPEAIEFAEKIDWVPWDGPHLSRRQSRQQAPRIYVWVQNETILENLINRHNRPVEAMREMAYKAMKTMGVEGHLNWSRYAGCSCPCSPGFIVKNATGFGRKDLHVNVIGVDK